MQGEVAIYIQVRTGVSVGRPCSLAKSGRRPCSSNTSWRAHRRAGGRTRRRGVRRRRAHCERHYRGDTTGAAGENLGLDSGANANPLADLLAALAQHHEPPRSLETNVHVDAETADRFRPAFEQVLDDPDEELFELIDDYGATDVTLTIDGYPPENYFEEISEDVRDHPIRRAIMDALDAANEPLSRDELEAATGIDEDTLDAEVEALQKKRIVRTRGREPHGFHLVDETERDNDDV